MNNVKTDTWVRAGLLLLALVNQILTIFGINPIPVSEEDAYTALTAIFTVTAALCGFWKNNSFTNRAVAADMYIKELKESEQYGD